MDGTAVSACNNFISETDASEECDSTPRYGLGFRLLVLVTCGLMAIGIANQRGAQICASIAGGPTSAQRLLLAAGQGDINGIHAALLDGASVNFRDESGVTPLISASLSGQTETVRELLDAGADVSPMTEGGITALRAAVCFQDNIEIVRMLLEAGADPNQRSPGRSTTLSIARDFATDSEIVDELVAHGAVSDEEQAKSPAPAGD